MRYIVLDLEWNQSDDSETRDNSLPVEIIEIGAVMLDEKLNIVSSFDHYIKPQVYKTINKFVKDFVSVNEDRIDTGEPFQVVCKRFLEWCGDDVIFCTWGMADLMELQRNMKYFGVANTFPQPFLFYDIQKFYSIMKEDGKIRRSLEYVVNELGITMKKEFHNALNDAHYTALVCKKIDFYKAKAWYSIDTYRVPKKRSEEIYAEYDTYEKFVSMEYRKRDNLLADRVVVSTRCYICQNICRKKRTWFQTGSKTYYYLGYCKEHGYIKGRLRVKKTDDDKYYAIRIMKQTDEKGAKAIMEKKKS